MLILGISSDGIAFPGATVPARLIFVLLSPADRPEEHLRDLAEVARFISRPERVEDLLNSRRVDDLLDAFGVDRPGRPVETVTP